MPRCRGQRRFLMDGRSRVQAKLDLLHGVISEHLTRRLAVQFFDLGRTAVRVNPQLAGSPNGMIFATADQRGVHGRVPIAGSVLEQ